MFKKDMLTGECGTKMHAKILCGKTSEGRACYDEICMKVVVSTIEDKIRENHLD